MTIAGLRVMYWTLALVVMGVAVGWGLRGVGQARRGELEAHRRSMTRALAWVAAFLVSYLAKVLLLGHESLDLWSPERRWVIDVHRTFVLIMLLAGGAGRLLAAGAQSDRAPARRLHRTFGWIAVPSGVAGLLTAGIVLVQMWQALPSR